MNTCPCCSNLLLRHARGEGIYWFCPHCWQEMPVFSEMILGRNQHGSCRSSCGDRQPSLKEKRFASVPSKSSKGAAVLAAS